MSFRQHKCSFPGCTASYQRKNHLSRHKAQHVSQESFQCPVCPRSFRRNDTLRRHMHQSHAEIDPALPLRQACSSCRAHKSRCDVKTGVPCTRCLRRQLPCSHSTPSQNPPRACTVSNEAVPPTKTDCSAPDKIQCSLKMYFDVFSAHWPFIHRSSFNMNQRNESPLLVQAMLVVGMWMASTDRLRAAAVELHGKLDEAIWEQRDKWDVSVAVTAEDRTSRSRQVPRAAKWPLPVYQAILLHIIFSQLHTADTKSARSSNKSNFSLGLDLKPCATEATIALLSSLVQSCRRLGMFHYPDIIASCRLSLPKLSSNSSSLIPHIWVGIEEVKRFNVALYRICRAISSSSSALSSSNPDILDPSPASRREARWQLSAHELQFPPPTNDRMWNTTTWEEWESAVALDPHVSMNPDHTISMDLGDYREGEWISKVARVLEIMG